MHIETTSRNLWLETVETSAQMFGYPPTRPTMSGSATMPKTCSSRASATTRSSAAATTASMTSIMWTTRPMIVSKESRSISMMAMRRMTRQGHEQRERAETDILHSISGVFATAHADLLIGDNRDNEFCAGFGNDTIHGGDGPDGNFDVLNYRGPETRTQGITVTFTAQGTGNVTSDEEGGEEDSSPASRPSTARPEPTSSREQPVISAFAALPVMNLRSRRRRRRRGRLSQRCGRKLPAEEASSSTCRMSTGKEKSRLLVPTEISTPHQHRADPRDPERRRHHGNE